MVIMAERLPNVMLVFLEWKTPPSLVYNDFLVLPENKDSMI